MIILLTVSIGNTTEPVTDKAPPKRELSEEERISENMSEQLSMPLVL